MIGWLLFAAASSPEWISPRARETLQVCSYALESPDGYDPQPVGQYEGRLEEMRVKLHLSSARMEEIKDGCSIYVLGMGAQFLYEQRSNQR